MRGQWLIPRVGPLTPSLPPRPARSNEYHFKLSAHFEIHDDIEVLRRMGLNRCTPEEINEMVSPEMRKFLPEQVQLTAGELLGPACLCLAQRAATDRWNISRVRHRPRRRRVGPQTTRRR